MLLWTILKTYGEQEMTKFHNNINNLPALRIRRLYKPIMVICKVRLNLDVKMTGSDEYCTEILLNWT